ncbi:8-oxoguanine deaminase [Shewanella sp. D64]|uniref:8-oxoguanine deaminase n=1 Tax=unclassified Shewanella TaxID=196818 RepID=UPI0022BA2AF9|nr:MULTISPECIES: 8-oxoguanine deaminase [unclassified Shewanella]MEC4728707.1 8-oxoguanine deaminase [Shewanella sp. D64]MEC4740645.1 8-oxoguanine deaminase [Shewanella sp. E94]WBJ94465.1 8-oxoguanine deaminase [Shewanella sp. MTB7]
MSHISSQPGFQSITQSRSRRLWIKNPLAIYTANNEDARGGVVIENDRIVELVPNGATPTLSYDSSFDAAKHVVMPGLINTHHHLYQTLTRALPAALNKPLFPWLKALYPVWARLQPDMLASATTLGLAELLLSGCTTVSDHHYLYPDALTEAMDIQVDAATKMGARVMLTRGSMSLGEKDGGLPPQQTVQTDEQILADCERVIKRYHDRREGAMIQIALAPCSPFSVTTELMQATAKLASTYNVRLHTHLAETNDENDFCIEKFSLRPLDYLESVGWLNEHVWLAHGIHFSASEIRRLGKARVGIAHCPTSNMILSSGICQTLALERAGAHVGLAVDGSASNDGSNMIQEVRQALLLNRLQYPADEISHLDVLRWATSGSAAVLGRDDIGALAVGKQADIALFKLDDCRFSGSHDPLAATILCGAHHADAVMVAGVWRVQSGEIVNPSLDLARLRQQHQEHAYALAAKA